MKKPFKETKFGQFLGKAGNVALRNGVDVADIAWTVAVDGPKAAITKTIGLLKGDDSPEGRALLSELEMKAMEFEKDMYALEIQDRESARRREVDISNSSAGWLTKNTGPVIALAYTFFNFVIYVLILTGQVGIGNEMAILIVNSITNIAMLIVGYHFGSSKGSRDKQATIDRMTS